MMMDNQMDSNTDLMTLVGKNDHWNVLKYIRIHKLRASELVLYHGSQILFTTNRTSHSSNHSNTPTTTTTTKLQFSHKYQTKIGYYTILEQVCLAALDCHQYNIAECCLAELEKELQLNHTQQQQQDNENAETSTIPISSTSIRYQLLRGRYYEAMNEIEMAQSIYTTLLHHNPSNMMASKREYTILKSQPNHELPAIASLNQYITSHSCYNDSSIFYELYVQYKNIGQYTYSIYCLQQVLYIMSAIRNADTVHMSLLHCELAECYITSIDDSTTSASATTTAATNVSTTLETIRMARKHMAMALELQPLSVRAQFGLVVIANRYLLYADEPSLVAAAESNSKNNNNNSSSSKNATNKAMANDERLLTLTHEVNVSKELIRYSTGQIIETTSKNTLCTKSMQSSIQALIDEYTEGL